MADLFKAPTSPKHQRKASGNVTNITLPAQNPSLHIINQVIELQGRITSKKDQLGKSNLAPKRILSDEDEHVIILALGLAVVGLNFHLGVTGFLYFKFLWFLALVGLLVAKPHFLEREFKSDFWAPIAVRLSSSSIVYSLLTFNPLDYEIHTNALRDDLLVAVLFMMITSLLMGEEIVVIRSHLKIQVAIQCGLSFILMLVFWTFDISTLIYCVCLYAFAILFFRFVNKTRTTEQGRVKETVSEHSESIEHELESIRKILEEQAGISTGTVSLSEIDDLTKKIRYLKFNLMMDKEENPGVKLVNNAVAIRRLMPTKNNSSQQAGKTNSTFTVAKTKGSMFRDLKELAKQDTSLEGSETNSPMGTPLMTPIMTSNNSHAPHTNSSLSQIHIQQSLANINIKSEEKKDPLKLTTGDCDKIIKLMLERQNITIDFESLNNSGKLGKETADFLKQHFTDSSNSIMEMFTQYDHSYADIDSKAFDYSPWSSYLEGTICDWNFDMIKLKEMTNGKHMVEYGCALIKKFGIMKTLKSEPTTLINFLNSVSDGYHWNPYHNSIHGADVANGVGYFLTQGDFATKFSDLEIACVLVSALVHDVGHPGVNNAFLINTKATEAMIYNDQAVLENFHAASFWKILQKPECDIMKKMSEKDYRFFRKLSVHVILDTDLTKHMALTRKFQETNDVLNLAEEADRFLSLSICLKCAGHGAKELSLHKRWSRRILEEFFQQGDKETKAGIPVSPLCQRVVNVAKSQEGFITYIVKPLFDCFVNKFFSDDTKVTVLDQIKTNLGYWAEEAQREENNKHEFFSESKKTFDDIMIEQGKKQ